MCDYQDKVLDVINNAQQYHNAFYLMLIRPGTNEIILGPEFYFHKRSIEMIDSDNFTLYIEYIYATLATWGMNRAGRNGPKMNEFEIFKDSIMEIENTIRQARNIDYMNLTENDWSIIEKIFRGINIMLTNTKIVGHSKVMAHLTPKLIPPVDGRHTLNRFLNKNVREGLDRGWEQMKEILSKFFYPIARELRFIAQANEWMGNQVNYPWDTSIFKIIDNLILGATN